jgi:hypothetical protein
MVRLAQFQILEEDLIQLVVVVLARVDDHMVHVSIQRRHDARQPDDFRASSNDGGSFHGGWVSRQWSVVRGQSVVMLVACGLTIHPRASVFIVPFVFVSARRFPMDSSSWPMTSSTFPREKIRVRSIGVEDLAGPEQGDHLGPVPTLVIEWV